MAKHKIGDKVSYKHPYTGDIIVGEIYDVHKETKISERNGTETSIIWYEMETYGDEHCVGNCVLESQIID